MHYIKRNTKYSILVFLIIVLFVTISISTLAKTEVYFSLYDNPQKEIIKNINQAEAFINIAIYIFTDKEITIPLVKAKILFTGSYNRTFSANHRNDENLMSVDDPEIISRYQNQFEKLWLDKFSLERIRQLYQKANVNFPFLSGIYPKREVQTININTVFQDEFIKILKIYGPIA